jgi:hypothetical protein
MMDNLFSYHKIIKKSKRSNSRSLLDSL